eukprot:GILK01012996.1.p1 GENE.GILK01012996.1~~GILK01012996.1.p1  ORF type:complete len:166 (-),score=13.92 GILK01012996.1:478-936(-)
MALVGKAFELSTAALLSKFRFSVRVCGGANDRGVDFRGVWSLNDQELDILGQCKNEQKPIGPRALREFEGVLASAKDSARTLGVFVSASGFTTAAYQQLTRSRFPILLLSANTDHIVGLRLSSAAQTKLPLLQVGRGVDSIALYYNGVPLQS